MKMKIEKKVTNDGLIKWTLYLNDEPIDDLRFYTSRMLTNTSNESDNGIFKSGRVTFWWGKNKKTFRMLPVLQDNQTADECLANLVINIITVRSWTDKLIKENSNKQIACLDVEDF